MPRLAQLLITVLRISLLLSALVLARPAHALTPQTVEQLGFGESDDKVAAVAALVAEGDARALALLEALSEGDLYTSGKRVLIIKGDEARDALSDAAVTPAPEDRDEVSVNNRLRREVGAAIAALKLVSPERDVRLAAAKALSGGADPAMLPLVKKAAAKEADPVIKPMLEIIQATLELQESSKETRLAAIRMLGGSNNPNTRQLLLSMLEKGKDGSAPDDDIVAEAQRSLRAVEGRLAWGERIAQVFSGISLGSILLLAALGLAITYGLMGVINMAHGELIMIGAYATYLIQNLFRAHAPDWFNAYLIAAVPVSFAASALVGMILERTVIRFLYGRPLETLLATWGISLFLIQLVRNVFGAQNVQVENPAWMSGGVELLSNVVLPYNRIVIIGFALLVLLLVWLALTRTRLGLFVRGVTQNRAMASCMGVHTARVDTWCFGLGSGIAGLAGCALSQVGNVGPDLGQSYIVDSFMVVVLGGVGQLAGTVYAALGLGVVNKFLEAWSGAVLAKIMVLVFIIVFIQKRPQGMFALKGRFADA
jgi:urea transport system permease protein